MGSPLSLPSRLDTKAECSIWCNELTVYSVRLTTLPLKSLTGEPILPSQTANQYLATPVNQFHRRKTSQTANQYLARYWFAVCDGKIGSPEWPDIGSLFATVKLVHRSEIYHEVRVLRLSHGARIQNDWAFQHAARILDVMSYHMV